jgi:hypothetical protein
MSEISPERKTIRFKPTYGLSGDEVVVSSNSSRRLKILSGDSKEKPTSSGVGRRLTATIISTLKFNPADGARKWSDTQRRTFCL